MRPTTAMHQTPGGPLSRPGRRRSSRTLARKIKTSMCLMMTVSGTTSQRSRLEAAAREASATGLIVELDHPPRWWWAREQPARVTVSEAGGCACSFLTDEADWGAEVWTMRPDVLDRLAQTLEILAELGPAGLAIEVLWTGTTPQRTVRISSAELGALVRSSRLGTRTRYEVQGRP